MQTPTDLHPVRVGNHWLFPDGTRLPVIAGGDGEGEGEGEGEGSSGGESSGSGDGPKTFTQAEIDRIVENRLARERAKYSDYDDIKSKADKYEELEAAQKTELEKAQERAKAAEKAKTEAEQRAKQALTRAAVLAEAAGKVVDPDAAWRLIDSAAIEYDEDGTPSNVGDLVTTLLEERPYLAPDTAGSGAGKTGARSAEQGSRGSGDTIGREDLANMTPEEVEKAFSEGRLAHLTGAKQ